MTKSEYMEALQNKLECFNRELQQEIMEDYEQHFAEGIAAGKTEEEIMAELGSIEDMIRELPEEDIIREDADAQEERAENSMPEAGRQSNAYSGEYKAVVIDGEIADVSLEYSDDGQIHADYSSGDPDYCYYQYEENGILYLGVKRDQNSTRAAKRAVKFMLFGKTVKVDLDGSFEKSFEKTFRNVWNGGGDGDTKLQVRISARIPRVEVKTRNGDVEVQDVNPEELSVRTTSGDIAIRHVTVDRLDLNSTSGDITAEQIYSGSMDVHVSSGDMSLDNAETGSLSFQGASGDISGTRVRGNVVNVRTGSGDVELNGAFESYHIGTGSGDVDVRIKAGAKEVRVSTGSGDVEVDVTEVESTEVTVGTGSGEAVIYGSDGARYHVTKGSNTVGSGECKVLVTTGSGDAEVRRRG